MTGMAPAAADQGTTPLRHALASARKVLPRGGALSEESWRIRHRGITVLLWLHVAALPVVGVLTGETTGHSLFEAAIVGVLGVGACLRRLSPTTRSALATLGLVICSA